MTNIYIYRLKPEKMKSDKLATIAKDLGIKNKLAETDEAIVVHDSTRALAYANQQPDSPDYSFTPINHKALQKM